MCMRCFGGDFSSRFVLLIDATRPRAHLRHIKITLLISTSSLIGRDDDDDDAESSFAAVCAIHSLLLYIHSRTRARFTEQNCETLLSSMDEMMIFRVRFFFLLLFFPSSHVPYTSVLQPFNRASSLINLTLIDFMLARSITCIIFTNHIRMENAAARDGDLSLSLGSFIFAQSFRQPPESFDIKTLQKKHFFSFFSCSLFLPSC